MKYLVTGSAGFIGSHICETLVERGHEVVGLDNLSTGYMDNMAGFIDDMEFIEGDIRDLDTCHKAADGCDHVIHQAALGSVPRSVDDPIRTHENNATGTLNMLVAARDADADSFVFAASSSVYGDTDVLPKVETMPLRPMSPYATSKATCERYLKNFSDIYGLNTVGVRYFNIFGPRQDPDGPYAAVIPKFIQMLQDGEAPTIHWDGEQTRDFTFIDNAVQANINATKYAERASGEIVNIGCGDRTSINQIYQSLSKHLEVDIEPNYGDKRAGDVRDSLADISKAQRLIEYDPQIDVDEGLRRTVEWFVRG